MCQRLSIFSRRDSRLLGRIMALGSRTVHFCTAWNSRMSNNRTQHKCASEPWGRDGKCFLSKLSRPLRFWVCEIIYVLRRRSYFETGTKMVDHCDNCGCEALIIFSALPSRPPSLVRPGDWFFVRQNMFAYGYYWTVYGARINASKCLHRPPVAPKGSKWGQLGGTGFTVKSSDCVGLISCILFSV